MEETVSTQVQTAPAVEQANVFAFGPDEGTEFAFAPETVDASGNAEQPGGEQLPGGAVETGTPEGTEPREQKDIGEAFARESRRIEAKYRKEYEDRLKGSQAYRIGRRMLDEIIEKSGGDETAAAKTVDERWYAAKAKELGTTPEMARMLMDSRRQEVKSEPKDDFDANTRAAQIQREIAAMQLPEGFDPKAAYADVSFAEMLMEMPVKAAVRLYAAEQRAKQSESRATQQVAEKLKARQAVPQSTRPSASVSPEIDFSKMSSDEFWAYERSHGNF